MDNSILIAGGSLGGLRAAEQLRAGGWHGDITIVEREPHMPYNRPPLSKEALTTSSAPDEAGLAAATALPLRAGTERFDWQLGRRLVSANLAERVAHLGDGGVLAFDGLVVATGLRPRRLPFGPQHPGRHVLRTVRDAVALRSQLRPGARLVVVGGGFIGCEVAATATTLGCHVTVVEPLAQPMLGPLGPVLADAIRRHHEDLGIRFCLGRGVRDMRGDHRGLEVELDDGDILTADVVVEAIGARPNVEWLEGNGLDLSDGVLCDAEMRVEGRHGVVAVGDIARYPSDVLGGRPTRIEHWAVPTDTARRAARTLLQDLTGVKDAAPLRAQLPSFWSDQFGMRIQGFGISAAADTFTILEGTAEDIAGGLVVGAQRAGRLVGIVAIGVSPARLGGYRRELQAGGVSSATRFAA